MDLNKELQQIFIASLQNIFEEKFPAKFDVRQLKHLEIDNSINDIAIHFEIANQNINQKVYYFMDRKFTLNLIKCLINDIQAIDLNNDFILRIITELNNLIIKKKSLNSLIIKKKVTDKAENEYTITKPEIIKGYGSLLQDGKLSMSLFSFNSDKGDFSVGFLTEDSMNKIKDKNTGSKSPQKTYTQVFHSKESKDEFSGSGSLVSAVQLLELKRVVLSNLNEIKDLRGDSEFLLRKSKAITELSKIWFDILKEES
jgi:hypothetical protein